MSATILDTPAAPASTRSIDLPAAGGRMERYVLTGTPVIASAPDRAFTRVALSAAHVVADPFADADPSGPPVLDWDRTLAYRRYLTGLGLGIAEAMDTAQRGMGLDWPMALQLIRRTLADQPDALVFSGCGTDQLDPAEARSLDDVVRAYLDQLDAIQALGGRVILMASRALAAVARTPEDYQSVYARVLSEADKPVILHWLGEMFDPALAGYWGTSAFEEALETSLAVIRDNATKVDGIKISLLDEKKEIRMRRSLPGGIRMYTGDDFNYPDLIAGDSEGHSHALLGIFDAIAPVASRALAHLAGGEREAYDRLMAPTVPLSRLIFRSPTRFYKTGVVFMAYLNGHQPHPMMVGGQQAMRPLVDFTGIFKLADQAGLLSDPDLALERMRRFLAFYGV
jgi:hypothetical protein